MVEPVIGKLPSLAGRGTGRVVQLGRGRKGGLLRGLVGALLAVMAVVIGSAPRAFADAPAAGQLNAAIVNYANADQIGTYEGQCLVWVARVIKEAGGPNVAFGYNDATYQIQWAAIADQREFSVS